MQELVHGVAESVDIEPARLPQRCHRSGQWPRRRPALLPGSFLAVRSACVGRRAVGRRNGSPPLGSRTAACDDRDDARPGLDHESRDSLASNRTLPWGAECVEMLRTIDMEMQNLARKNARKKRMNPEQDWEIIH